MVTRHVLGVLVVLGCGCLAAAQDSTLQNRTANTLTATSAVLSPPATTNEIAWLAGRWTGTGLGGVCEEIWSAPAAGAMMGMFRLVREGKVVFYEILTFVEHEGSLLLRLKHFDPDLTGWEEKSDSVKFRLLKATPGAVYFDGLTFMRVADDRLEIFLAIRNRSDGSIREERFEMQRAAP